MKKTIESKQEISERQHFDIKANGYDRQYGYDNLFTKYKINKKSDDFVQFVKKYFHNRRVKILEVGCGTGEYTKIISKKLPQANITAFDISPESIKIAKKKCRGSKNVSFNVESAYKTNYKNKSFDVVFGFYILHHLDVKKVGREIDRVLKRGGVGFFYEPNILNPYVYLVKSNRYLKNKVGDSPDEWAVNPLSIEKDLKPLKVQTFMTEFILPVKTLNTKTLIMLDKWSFLFGKVPLLKYFGGSVQIQLFKK